MNEEMQKLGQSIINEIKDILVDLPNPDFYCVESKADQYTGHDLRARIKLNNGDTLDLFFTKRNKS